MTELGLPYGPGTRAIRRFLQRMAALNAEAEAEIVQRHGQAVATREYRAAEIALSAAVSRSGRDGERDAIAGPLIQLVRAVPIAANSGEPGEVVLRDIAEPALAALLALMMRDVLLPTDFARLYAPFEQAIPAALNS